MRDDSPLACGRSYSYEYGQYERKRDRQHKMVEVSMRSWFEYWVIEACAPFLRSRRKDDPKSGVRLSFTMLRRAWEATEDPRAVLRG